MPHKQIKMAKKKSIALIAHDNMKQDILEWAKFNKHLLSKHDLYATGTTGAVLSEELGLKITSLKSGPLGGISKSGRESPRGQSSFSSSSGTRWNRIHMIRM